MCVLHVQGQHDALNDSRRIVAHHPEALRPCLHEFVRAAVPALDQLRSVTVKNAITLLQVCSVCMVALAVVYMFNHLICYAKACVD